MTVQQTFATMGRSTVPLIAAAIVADLDVDPALVGVYVAIGAVAGFLTTMGCGGLIVRYGALRMTQVGMLALAVGLALPATGWLALFAVGAFVGGLGQAISTPSSSHLLGRLSPPRLAPLVFSIKQTGVPAGLMVAGVVAPVLATEAGWRTALLVIAGLRRSRPWRCSRCARASTSTASRAVAVAGRHPRQRRVGAARAGAARDVRRHVQLRRPAVAVHRLLRALPGARPGLRPRARRPGVRDRRRCRGAGPHRLGLARLAPGAAGDAAGRCSASAWRCRPCSPPRSDPRWPTWLADVVAILFSATAVSWHGVLLAEVARLSPPGRIGSTTGAVLAFGDAGALVLPLLFSAALR